MSEPVAKWKEDDVLSLPSGENDTFERKGAQLLDLTMPGVDVNEVRNELAKQLSAFANTGGGQIIYGLTNSGAVDNGGVARSVRGRQTTKEWLENVIPKLTEFEIIGFNVYEILPKLKGSSLAPDKSIYVVDVPDSDRAPHQSSRDLRYYVRISGNSLPAPHRLVEDIRNRARHPKIRVENLRVHNIVPFGAPTFSNLKSKFDLIMSLAFDVCNLGRVQARTSCLQVSATVPISSMSMSGNECYLRASTPGTALLELRNPLYPGIRFPLSYPMMCRAEVEALSQGGSLRGALTFGGANPDDVRIFITSFADSAPEEKQEFKLLDIDPSQYLAQVIRQQLPLIAQQR
jgi:hypothetical protein